MILILLIFYIPLTYGQTSKDIVKEYINPSKEYEFQRIFLHPKTGDVYLAGVNYLYRLGSDLRARLILKTGPKESSERCLRDSPDVIVYRKEGEDGAGMAEAAAPTPESIVPPSPDSCLGFTMHLAPYHNQALILDEVRDIIIDCQTLFRGACMLRDPLTLSYKRVVRRAPPTSPGPLHYYEKTVFGAKVCPVPSKSMAFLTPPPPPRGGSREGAADDDDAYRQLLVIVNDVGPSATYYLAGYVMDPPASIMSLRVRTLHGQTSISSNKETYGTHVIHAFAPPLAPTLPPYAYLALERRRGDEDRYDSRLARICLTDPLFKSYTEVGLLCGSGPADLTAAHSARAGPSLLRLLRHTPRALGLGGESDEGGGTVLVAAFSSARGHSLCLYSLSDAKESFDRVVSSKTRDSTDLCHAIGSIFGNGPTDPNITAARPILTLDVDQGPITAIATDVVGEHTVAFLGTGDGRLLKLQITSPTSGMIYADIKVDQGFSLLPSLELSKDGSFIYAMTKRKVIKIRVQNCEVYADCKACLSSKDVYCGWCNIDNKCKTKASCDALYDNTAKDSYSSSTGIKETIESWVSIDTGQCSIITWLNPAEFQITSPRNIRIVINYLPTVPTVPSGEEYACVFTAFGSSVETRAKRISLPQGVKRGEALGCRSPDLSQLSSIPYGQNSYSAILSIKYTKGPEFTYTNFTVYDCTSYRSCTECTSSPYQCHWCVKNNLCSPDVEQDCRGDFLINGIKVLGATSRAGPEFCPYLVMVDPQPVSDYSKGNKAESRGQSIIVPAERNLDLKMRVFNIQRFMIQDRSFTCQFNQNGKIVTRNGRFEESTNVLRCDSVGFSYSSNTPNTTVNFGVLWSPDKMIDGPFPSYQLPASPVHGSPGYVPRTVPTILVYKCSSLSHDCGRCMLLPARFGCSWCENECAIQEQCFGTWLERNSTCPNPVIDSFFPKAGPYEGGTDVTIKGYNLGRQISDFLQGITLAGVPCNPYTDRYVPTNEIVCKVERSGKEVTGPVVIKIGQYTGASNGQFSFVNFGVYDIVPKVGSKAGRTRVTLTGFNLNAGNFAHVRLADHMCIILSRASNSTECLTTPFVMRASGASPTIGPVIYGIDGNFREGLSIGQTGLAPLPLLFEYVDNPRVSGVESPAGILSGGINIDVTGQRFNYVQEAFIMITVRATNLTQPCTVTSARTMSCTSPRVLGSPELAFATTPPPLHSPTPYTPTLPPTSGSGQKSIVDHFVPNHLGLSLPASLDYGFVLDGTYYHIEPSSDTGPVGSEPDKFGLVGPVVRRGPRSGSGSFTLYPDPVVKPFPPPHVKYYRTSSHTSAAAAVGDYLSIEVDNSCPVCTERDFRVTVGGVPCEVTSVSERILNCLPPTPEELAKARDKELVMRSRGEASAGGDVRVRRSLAGTGQMASAQGDEQYLVRVWVGSNLITDVGYLRYGDINSLNGVAGLTTTGIISISMSVLLLLIGTFFVFFFYRRKSNQNSRALKNMQEQMTILESQVAQECKAAFAELQTDMTELTNDVSGVGIPLLEYRIYCMKVLFPNATDHSILHDTFAIDPLQKNKVEKGLKLFEQLLSFKTFLLLFIQTLENDRYFSMRDRVNVASLIMVALQGKLDYCTDILKTLLAELIEKSMDGNSHPKLLLRRTESVAEKMLTAWFTFLLHRFLRDCAGEPLFLLFRAIKQQADKGPIDQITSEAKYSLSEEKLLRCHIEYDTLTIHAIVPDPDRMGSSLDVYVKVLDVDTISQVKEKILDYTFKNFPHSMRPSVKDLDLEWRTGIHGRVILRDEDITSHIDGEWKRLNTLKHYKVSNEATLVLVRTGTMSSASQSCVSSLSLSLIAGEGGGPGHGRYQQLHNHGNGYNWKDRFPMESQNVQSPFSSARNTASISHASAKNRPVITTYGGDGSANNSSNLKLWHLVKHYDNEPKEEMGNKMMSEIYLTRLLATKGTLQKFVDDLFDTIFSTVQRSSSLPLAIKFMFDFLDDQAFQHQITDSEVVHTWKSNSLPLRFWVNLIKNPNFIFDVHKSNTVDACLSVVAQTFMDSCSTSDQRLGKDSPSSKLLYAKDILVYKEWVERYYQDIRMMSPITEQDMLAFLAEESNSHGKDFNTRAALWELYRYVLTYNTQLMTALNGDEIGKKKKLAQRLQTVHSVINGEV